MPRSDGNLKTELSGIRDSRDPRRQARYRAQPGVQKLESVTADIDVDASIM
jgi:hypothetical protein